MRVKLMSGYRVGDTYIRLFLCVFHGPSQFSLDGVVISQLLKCFYADEYKTTLMQSTSNIHDIVIVYQASPHKHTCTSRGDCQI